MQLLFAATLLLSAGLLFVAEPMSAKMVLPLLGGSPSVWNTCLVFYQAMLLAGYVYAHLSVRWLGVRRQAMLHTALLCAPWAVLPIGVAKGWLPPAEANPIPWLLMLLSVSLGLPFLVVSASAPLLQAWFSRTGDPAAGDPYFLYSASNLGSMVALLGYPLLVEPHLALGAQSQWWMVSYGLLMALVVACALVLWRSKAPEAADSPAAEATPQAPISAPAPTLRRRLRWLALSLVPSSLLLGVTTYIATDIASAPLVWVIPLSLYLLSFVMVFARRQLLPHRLMVWLQPPAVVAVAAMFYLYSMGSIFPSKLLLLSLLHLLAFFLTAMVCHGELAADRPSSEHLTEFYLWISLGGVLGGLLNALVAPVVFPMVLEYPLAIVAACFLRPQSPARSKWARKLDVLLPAVVLALFGGWARFTETHGWIWPVALAALAVFLMQRRRAQFGLGVLALLAVSLLGGPDKSFPAYIDRAFFGVLRVDYLPAHNAYRLHHNSTVHGIQSADPVTRRAPWTYYHFDGPLGRIFDMLHDRPGFREIGVVGLGIGTIGAYGEPGQRITFYEIDPAVDRIARNTQFYHYLDDCKARVDVVLGDGRLSLANDSDRRFDLLIVDAFSSDSIPVHLITQEAVALYFGRLSEHGVLAFHISNRCLDLEPVLGNIAADANHVAYINEDYSQSPTPGKSFSNWVVMARTENDLGILLESTEWRPLKTGMGGRSWTDNFSDLLSVIRWSPQQPSESQKAKGSYIARGLAFVDRGDLPQAAACFQQAIQIDRADFAAHSWLGAVLQKQGRSDEAIDEYRQALRSNRWLVKVHISLADLLFARGEAESAKEHLEAALAIDPRVAEAHGRLGRILASQKRYEEAVEHYRKGLEIDPRALGTHLHFGEELRRQGRFDEAIEHFRKAVEIQPGDAQTRDALRDALGKQATDRRAAEPAKP